LNISDRHQLLIKVKNGSFSFEEMKAEALCLKQMHRLQKAFLKLTNLSSWKEAEQQFPQWTSDEILRPFYPLFSTAKAAVIHPSFINFVQSLMQAKQNKTKLGEWKKFEHPETKIISEYNVFQCDVLKNLTAFSNLAATFTLAIADIPYGLGQEGSDWDTEDWRNPEDQITMVTYNFINIYF
jgi:hypothetical protein